MNINSRTLTRGAMALAAALLVALAASFAVCQSAYAEVGTLAKGTVTTVARGGDAENMKGYTNVRALYRYGWQDGREWNTKSATVKTVDVDGDGYGDTIKVVGAKSSANSPYLNSLKIDVNGDRVRHIRQSGIVRVAVSVFTLKNNMPFLWIEYVTKTGKTYQAMYKCRSGKIKRMFSNYDMKLRNTSNQCITHFASSGNNLHVTFTLTTTVTGESRAVYTYKYSSGKLKRTRNTSTQISYATNTSGTFTKNSVTAAGKFKVYKTTSLKKTKTTVKVGKRVQPIAMLIKGNRLLYKVKVGSKTGWIACPKIKKKSSHSPTSMFYETYGKVKLKSSIPTYSSTTYYKASDLQKYNDHALFIARNEIMAHCGKTFSNAELKSYFAGKAWYKNPNMLLRGRTAAEQANIDLILSIEQGRQSLFIQ